MVAEKYETLLAITTYQNRIYFGTTTQRFFENRVISMTICYGLV